MLKSASLLSMSALLITLSLTADTVDNAEIVTFTAATPAKADDVNQTIQELVSAVNDNAARVATLEGQVATLQSEVGTLETQVAALEATPTLLSILTGSSFTVYSHEVGVGASSDGEQHGILNSFVFGESAQYQLGIGGVLSVGAVYVERGTAVRVNHHQLDPAFLSGQNQEGVTQVTIDTDINATGFDIFSGTWSLSGSTLTVTYDGDTETYLVTPDGNMFVSGGAEVDDEALTPGGPLMTNSDIVIGIRAVAP